jgi:8-hydroxy-5-deazaflavin:NADPH oxidoreductase
MNIGIFGTGMVGRAHAAKLAANGHGVMMGTRDPAATLARSEPDYMGNPPFPAWLKANDRVRLGTFEEAASFGEMVINATLGSASLQVMRLAGPRNLAGKILIDVSNATDESTSGPPTLFVCSTDSLAEQIQSSLPDTKVVKTLNIVGAPLHVDPGLTAGGDHHAFVSGDDAQAKSEVARFLHDEYGWLHVIDIGDITSARAAEMVLPLWIQLFSATGTPMFGFKIVGLPGE